MTALEGFFLVRRTTIIKPLSTPTMAPAAASAPAPPEVPQDVLSATVAPPRTYAACRSWGVERQMARSTPVSSEAWNFQRFNLARAAD